VSNAKSVKNGQNADNQPFKTCLFIVGLTSLICFNIAIPTCPAAAASEAVRWTKVNIPTEGEAGNWVLAAGSDIRYLTSDSDGTLYAYVKGPTYTLYRSADGGYSWEHIGNVRDAITDIAISPQDARTIYYATASGVYRSTNNGQTFQTLPPNPGGAGANHREITSIDIVRLDSNIVIAGTRDTDSAEFGGVYILDEADIVPSWADTGIGGYDVVAVAFSPQYRDDGRMVAVVTDENDTYICTRTADAGWNDEIGYARLDVAAASAEIAFPVTDNADEPVVFVAIDTGAGGGDVYKISGRPAPDTSTATDLNAGSAYGSSDIDITGLATYEDNSAVILLAGAADSAMTYVSTDGGATWTRSLKAPTGGSETGVLIGPDFGTTGRMYAVTSGEGSALSVSRDLGASWNQLSLVDTTLNTIVDLAPSPRYSQDRTIFMLTFGSGPYSGGLWRSLDGGDRWERTLSDSPDTLESLSRVALPPEYGDNCQTAFAAGVSRGSAAIWESTDSGQTYRRRFTRNPAGGGSLTIDTWAVADKTTILIGSYDGAQGMVYKTINRGFSFTEGMPAGNQPLHDIALSPDFAQDGTVLVGNSDGHTYVVDNQGGSFELLSGEAVLQPFSGVVTVACDPAFSKNHTVYAAGENAGSGVYRFVIGKSAAWESIDDTLPAGAMLNRLTVAEDGTFYAANAAADGGMERSLNPAFSSPTFQTITRGLNSGATLYGLWEADHILWSVDTASTRLMTYDDTLTSPPVPVSPDDGASAMGNLIDHTVRNITLDWETMDGATGYEWECSYDDTFASVSDTFGDSTSGTSVRLPALEPATTYHWRVRASSPSLSPWSEKRSFTTVMDTEAVTLRSESPTAGATGVPVKPIFQWTAVIGAEAYELLVATDADMDDTVITRTDEYAPAGNVWQCDVSLDYATTYYWRVRAINASTSSAWSTTGVFTTEDAPLSPESPEETAPAMDHEAPVIGSLAEIPAPVQIETPPTPAPSVNGIMMPDLSETPGVPDWILYLIGGLLATVILALIVVLAMVIKIKRIT
jgi:trimeric autotransporter adhesin